MLIMSTFILLSYDRIEHVSAERSRGYGNYHIVALLSVNVNGVRSERSQHAGLCSDGAVRYKPHFSRKLRQGYEPCAICARKLIFAAGKPAEPDVQPGAISTLSPLTGSRSAFPLSCRQRKKTRFPINSISTSETQASALFTLLRKTKLKTA